MYYAGSRLKTYSVQARRMIRFNMAAKNKSLDRRIATQIKLQLHYLYPIRKRISKSHILIIAGSFGCCMGNSGGVELNFHLHAGAHSSCFGLTPSQAHLSIYNHQAKGDYLPTELTSLFKIPPIMQPFVLILAFVAIASAFFNPNLAHQAPLAQPPEPQYLVYPTSHLYFIRCAIDTHWACLFLTRVYCGCVANKHPELGDHASAKTKSITSFEVIAELQPGNNHTLVSLYTVECGLNERGGCHFIGERWVCGCLPDFDLVEGGDGFDGSYEGGKEHLRELGVAVDHDTELRAEKRGREERQADDEAGEGPIVASPARDFSFSKVSWPRCNKPGYHIKCCPEGRKSVCFCGSGTGCPRE
jgi:hypothetical protein